MTPPHLAASCGDLQAIGDPRFLLKGDPVPGFPDATRVVFRGTRVALYRLNNHLGALTVRALTAGEVVFRLRGRVQSVPTRYSIQVGAKEHLEPVDPVLGDSRDEDSLWQFLNHGCRPNLRFQSGALVASEAVVAGAELRFNYNTTELEMHEPFRCGCSAPGCQGWIRGYRHLSAAARRELNGWLAQHLVELDQPAE